MKNFKFDLNAKVAIYVPSTTDVAGPGRFDRFPAAGKPLVNGVVRIDEQDMKDILAAAPKSQRGWIRTRLGYMVVV